MARNPSLAGEFQGRVLKIMEIKDKDLVIVDFYSNGQMWRVAGKKSKQMFTRAHRDKYMSIHAFVSFYEGSLNLWAFNASEIAEPKHESKVAN